MGVLKDFSLSTKADTPTFLYYKIWSKLALFTSQFCHNLTCSIFPSTKTDVQNGPVVTDWKVRNQRLGIERYVIESAMLIFLQFTNIMLCRCPKPIIIY